MLLALDTCDVLGGIALGNTSPEDGATRGGYLFRPLSGGSYSELLLETVSALMKEAEAELADLQAIVVVTGPGSFTGIRIGVSAAKALAEALELPLVALSRLALLARQSKGEAIAVLDAGRDEYYVGLPGTSGSAEEVLLDRDQLLTLMKDSPLPVVICQERLSTALPQARLVEPPTAVETLAAGMEAFRSELFCDVATLEANYVRRTGEEMLARIAKHAELREIARSDNKPA